MTTNANCANCSSFASDPYDGSFGSCFNKWFRIGPDKSPDHKWAFPMVSATGWCDSFEEKRERRTL